MDFLAIALDYARRGWPVFPLSRSKVPFKGTHGHLDASTDPQRVAELFKGRAGANIGLQCGSIVVVDCDGPEAYARLKAAAEPHGGVPATLTAQTTREDGGLHFFFTPPPGTEIRTRNETRASSGASGIDLKGAGGYVVLPPSINRKGREYKWLRELPIAEMPVWLIEFLQSLGNPKETPFVQANSQPLNLGEKPAFLDTKPQQNQSHVADRLSAALAFEFTAHNLARIRAALRAVPPSISYDSWVQLGMALHHLGWTDSQGNPVGLALWHEMSARDAERYQPDKLDTHWRSFGRRDGPTRTVGYVLAIAQEHGWDGSIGAQAREPAGDAAASESVNGHTNGHYALPAILTAAPGHSGHAPILFPDTDKSGNPKATCSNARVALRGLGIECQHDVFHEKLILGGHPIAQWAGEFSDNAVQMLRVIVHQQFGFDPGLQNTNDAAIQECLQKSFDPVCDYLDGLKWDGTKRLGRWLADYLGAEPTALNAEIGRLALVAAVRRAYQPGSKFDQIIVLEGVEGTGKSSAIEILAGASNFSDQSILALDDKAQQEAMAGVWLYEIADLAGMSKAEVERVKAFASRKTDRARPAYGRSRVDRARRCIFFATTNNETYLKSQTGNRRFWPVRTGRLDLIGLQRDRNQLWAEAAELEASGVTTVLDSALWGAVGELQEARRDHDHWDDILRHVEGKIFHIGDGSEYRISTRDLFELHLRVTADRISDGSAKRLCYAMRRLGWEGPKVIRLSDKTHRGYTRPAVTG